MKILIIGSCTKKKRYKHEKQPTCIDLKSKKVKNYYIKKYPQFSCKANLMYNGKQHESIECAITQLKNIADVDYYIVSAGYGIIKNSEEISAYDCSFSSKNKQEIFLRANQLEISQDYKKLIVKNYDFIYIALGKDYLETLQQWDDKIKSNTLAFFESQNKKILVLKADRESVLEYSKLGYKIHGVLGFKGDLLRILCQQIFKKYSNLKDRQKIFSSKEKLSYFINNVILKTDNQKISDFIN